MIKLDIQEYCGQCMDFSPDVARPIKMHTTDNEIIQTDTVIRCEYRGRCEAIRRYLEKHQDKSNGV